MLKCLWEDVVERISAPRLSLFITPRLSSEHYITLHPSLSERFWILDVFGSIVPRHFEYLLTIQWFAMTSVQKQNYLSDGQSVFLKNNAMSSKNASSFDHFTPEKARYTKVIANHCIYKTDFFFECSMWYSSWYFKLHFLQYFKCCDLNFRRFPLC